MNAPLPRKQLWTQHLLEDERLPVDEARVERAMDPMFVPALDNAGEIKVVTEPLSDDTVLSYPIGNEVNDYFRGLMRTAEIFIFELDDARVPLKSAWEMSMPDEFPPMPYKRMVLELAHKERAVPWIQNIPAKVRERGDSIMLATSADIAFDEDKEIVARTDTDEALYVAQLHDGDEDMTRALMVPALGLSEVEEGRFWDIWVPYVAVSSTGELGGWVATVIRMDPYTADNRFFSKDLREHQATASSFGPWLRSMAITAMQIIETPYVPKHEIKLPRGQRREMARRGGRKGPWSPKLYYVDMATAARPKPGKSDRHLSVRFMVRGHWVHRQDGKRTCTCHGWPASWRHAYVKGPVGAPWKGKPIYKRKPAA